MISVQLASVLVQLAKHLLQTEEMSQDSAGVIGLQMGSNMGASQAGMSMGGQRHAADIDAGPMDYRSTAVINLQMGSNQGDSQSGMNMGGRRDVIQ